MKNLFDATLMYLSSVTQAKFIYKGAEKKSACLMFSGTPCIFLELSLNKIGNFFHLAGKNLIYYSMSQINLEWSGSAS